MNPAVALNPRRRVTLAGQQNLAAQRTLAPWKEALGLGPGEFAIPNPHVPTWRKFRHTSLLPLPPFLSSLLRVTQLTISSPFFLGTIWLTRNSHRADATIASQATGAMSWAFITALKKNPQQSYVQLLNTIRDELQTRYTQKPQLSCSHPLGEAYLVTTFKTSPD